MAIPLYGAASSGGVIYSMDDSAVVKDGAALAGTGGTAYTGTLKSGGLLGAGYGTLRKIQQHVPHNGAVTVTVTPFRDGNELAQPIARTLATGDAGYVVAPFLAAGTEVQVQVALSAFDAPAELGAAEITVIRRRSQR